MDVPTSCSSVADHSQGVPNNSQEWRERERVVERSSSALIFAAERHPYIREVLSSMNKKGNVQERESVCHTYGSP